MLKLFLPLIVTATVVAAALTITPVYPFGASQVAEFTVTTSSRILAVDMQGHILSSDDDGSTWSGSYEAGGYNSLTSIITLQNGNILAGGLSWDKAALFRSTDNAESWVTVGNLSLDTYSLLQLSTGAVLSFGVDAAGASVYRSLNNGQSFTRVLSRPDEHFFTYGIELSSHILAFQYMGRIYRSSSGGASWSHVATLPTRNVIKVIKASDGNLYAISLKKGACPELGRRG